MRPFRAVARTIDRKLFRRSMHMVRQLDDLRVEVEHAKQLSWAVLQKLEEMTRRLDQIQQEARMAHVATRTLLEDRADAVEVDRP